MNTIFYLSSFLAIITALLAISRRNAINGLLFMILTLLSLSVIFFISGAPYVAALEIMVYAGAIMVLFIFVVMMLNPEKVQENEWGKIKSLQWLLPAIISGVLLYCFVYAIKHNVADNLTGKSIGPKEVAQKLYTTYLLGVELAGILLLAGIVGAYHIGRQVKKPIHRFLK